MKPENLALTIELRKLLHQNPELSNQEKFTKQYLMDFLIKHTRLTIIDRGKWFYAIFKAANNKTNIAFRADIDAVLMEEVLDIPYGSKNPGVAHKCGHDGHAATMVGFALEVDQSGADKNIYFLFQHAEETGDGAAEACIFIEENNIEEIFAYHNMSGMPLNSVNTINGTANFASRGMTIKMTGKPTHASQPEFGANPAYSIAKVILSLEDLTSNKENKGIVLATVIQVKIGERAFGIAASKGELLLTIRAEIEEELERLKQDLEDLCCQIAQEEGLTVNFHYNDSFPATVNHPESTEKIRQVARKKGYRLIEMERGFRGSEDFGHYLKKTKGAIYYIGNGENYPQVHTNTYDFNDQIIETSVELFKGLVEF
jgi:amidohydrolase